MRFQTTVMLQEWNWSVIKEDTIDFMLDPLII